MTEHVEKKEGQAKKKVTDEDEQKERVRNMKTFQVTKTR